MNKKQIEYLYELLDLVNDMDIYGIPVYDNDGTLIGLALGEPEFIEMLDFEWDTNKKIH